MSGGDSPSGALQPRPRINGDAAREVLVIACHHLGAHGPGNGGDKRIAVRDGVVARFGHEPSPFHGGSLIKNPNGFIVVLQNENGSNRRLARKGEFSDSADVLADSRLANSSYVLDGPASNFGCECRN